MSGLRPDNSRDAGTDLFEVTLRSIGDAVIATDLLGRVTFLNPEASRLTGWRDIEAIGTPLETIFRILNEESRAVVENPALRALREGVVVGLANHTVLIAKDGAERPIDDSAAPIRALSGERQGVVLVFRDVTERREAERALRVSEERFRLLVEGVKDYAIFMLDPTGRVTSWNSGAERIKGYKAEEIIGHHVSRFYPKEAVESGWPSQELERARIDGRFEDDGWRVRQDGSRFWANVVITAVRDDAGAHRGFAKVTRDLTRQRELERARIEATAFAELDRRKDHFLAMLSHELRNPLAPILNAIHLLKSDNADEETRRRALIAIERQTRQLTRIIDDLIEVSRIVTGHLRLRREETDLCEVVGRALDVAQSLAEQRRIDFQVSLPAEPVQLHADPTRLEQVVVNLLTNAIKYSDLGGKVDVVVEREAALAVLRVRDNGIGIEGPLLARLFEPFTQADSSLERSQSGLGVGLSIVRNIVELHGGSVEARSEGPNRGSEFIVRLPITKAMPAALGLLSPSDQVVHPKGLRILVVDDNKDAADTMAELMRLIGHEVRIEYAGTAALTTAKVFQPDVVLLDIGLPGLNGYEVARAIRVDPRLKTSRLIAVSGYGQPSDRDQSKAAGFDAHLVKPVSFSDVENALKAPFQRL
jgi:PAS domain S-box-containing protein